MKKADQTRRASSAGASAARRYRRLAAKDADEQRRVRTPRAVAIVAGASAAAGVAVFVLCRGANALVVRWMRSQFPTTHATRTEYVPMSLSVALAVAAVLAAGATLGRDLWGRRQSTEAYRVGAEGERGAARVLAPLEGRGWIVLHDRLMSKGRENIDHIAIGPAGVVVIETKNWSGKVRVTPQGLRRNGRDERATLEQVLRQTAAVRAALGPGAGAVPIRPFLYVHRAQMDRDQGPFKPARPSGVRVCDPRKLRGAVTDGPDVLAPERVKELAATLASALPSA